MTTNELPEAQPVELIRTGIDGDLTIYRSDCRIIAMVHRWIPGGFGSYANVHEEWVHTVEEAKTIIREKCIGDHLWMIQDLDATPRILMQGTGSTLP